MHPLVEQVYHADRTRFFSLLYTPESKRADIAALYALSAELAKIPALAGEPMPGEIRLQWWREVLNRERTEEAMQNPLAREVLRVTERYNLPIQPFENLLEARSFDLYSDPVETVKQLEGYAGETASSVMQLAAMILDDGRQPSTGELAGYGGVAATIAHILSALPHTLRRGQTYVPLELLHRHNIVPATLHAGQAPPGSGHMVQELATLGLDYLAKARAQPQPGHLLPAFLELSVVAPLLKRAAGKGSLVLNTPTSLPNWRKQWHMWRAARKGEI